MKSFYTVKDVADATGFSPGTIQNRIGEGKLFAIQATERGAFRIPASAYHAYLASLGIRPPAVEMLPPTEFVETSPRELYEREIAPVLAREGYEDVPALLRAIEGDPSLYERYRDVIHVYNTYIARAAAFA